MFNKIMSEKKIKIGIDAGSTTLKAIVLDENDTIIYKSYRRHKANINPVFIRELEKIKSKFLSSNFQITITGSAGMGIAERCEIPFIQEVVAAVELVQRNFPDAHTLIDLGGEDAKMVFFGENRHPDIRMNGSCAGGTGAFIDQMASLLNIPVENFGEQAERFEKIYPVASRCGVFAKTDIQNLIARNVSVPDIAASTLYAVALQSVTSLARGVDILPPILCIGGPLTFIPVLRKQFCEVLNLNPEDLILPENSEFFPAFGAALSAGENNSFSFEEIIEKCKITDKALNKNALPSLFSNKNEYEQWKQNRNIKRLTFSPLSRGDEQRAKSLHLGIDSGSTTTKIVIIDNTQNIVYQYYANNEGNSLKKVSEGLTEFFNQTKEQNIEAKIVSSAVTGYGEDLIKQAFNLDFGIVETMAHLAGAKYINPDVSFVLDIGGQDMKSMFVHNGVISNIELNEACSSGCGSFLQNFASTMNLTLAEFTQKACLAKNPADLGTRCTVFMNSKVKQSLRENSGIDDIAAGLAYSVVKNCLFKVLKINNLNALGENIVVQGGTFRNDAVYRTLELLSDKTISTTDYPELMGAFGAALFAYNSTHKNIDADNKKVSENSSNVHYSYDISFTNKELQCKGCTNQCQIMRFNFDNGNVCFAGNKCEKIFTSSSKSAKSGFNAFATKNELVFS
jgi:Activator of 2-hydroxyglutaryl-CoA dehydratase (HSP70-class ATPase domain)